MQKTVCGVAVGVLLWVATMGVMLADPNLDSSNPGVFESIQLNIPGIDPETGERTIKPRFMPL